MADQKHLDIIILFLVCVIALLLWYEHNQYIIATSDPKIVSVTSCIGMTVGWFMLIDLDSLTDIQKTLYIYLPTSALTIATMYATTRIQIRLLSKPIYRKCHIANKRMSGDEADKNIMRIIKEW